MGIAKGALKTLLKEASRRPFSGRVLTLGRQDIHFGLATLQEVAAQFGVKIADPAPVALSRKEVFADRGYLSDECVFRALGFTESKALDYADFESADYLFDLNSGKVPEHLSGAFDVIIDGGTIEHVFHIPNALNNIYEMLRPGGRVVHVSPSSNHMDHGFYMFSPTLFWDYYTQNRFEINTFQVFRYTPRHDVEPWRMSDYRPGCLDGVSFGGLDDGMYGIACVATKTEHSTGHVVPQQRFYAEGAWGARIEAGPLPESAITDGDSGTGYTGLKRLAKTRFPFVYRMVRAIVNLPRVVFGRARQLSRRIRPARKGLGLKVVARY